MQATAARRISAEPRDVAQIERVILRVTYKSAAGTRPGDPRPDSPDQPGAAAGEPRERRRGRLIAVPLTVMGGQAGVLQGERRWLPLALVYVAVGVPRLLLGSALIALAADRAVRHGRRRARRVRAGDRRLRSRLRRPRSEHVDGERAADPVPAAARSPAARRPCSRSSRSATSTSSWPATCSTARRGALRRRPDPDQGRAVPPAVRRRRGLPGDVHASRTTPRPGPRPARWSPASASVAIAGALPPAHRSPWSSSAATSTPRSSRGCGCSPCSAPCWRCSSCSSTPCWRVRAGATVYAPWAALAAGRRARPLLRQPRVAARASVVGIDALLLGVLLGDQPLPARGDPLQRTE